MSLPNGWKKVKLGDCFDVQLGKMLNKNAREQEPQYPYIANVNVRWGSLNTEQLPTMFFSEREREKFALKKDDILMCEGGEIGRCSVLKESLNNVFYQKACHRLRAKNNLCIPDFLYFYINNYVTSREIVGLVGESSIAHLPAEKVVQIQLNLPPLEEQKKIAATLSVWDSAIEKMEKLIDAKEDQKKSLIWKLIENTDAIRKEKIKIDDLFDEVCEKNHPDADVLTIIQGTGTLLREKSGRDIVYDKKSLSNYKFVKKGDFIIHLRSFEGGLEVANQDGIVSPAYIILRPKIEVSTDYLYALFHTNRFINYTISPAVEGARDGRSVKYDALKKQFINLPTFSEQKYIAKIITTAEKELSLLKQQLENYKKQKQGLMQKLLTGQWRVK